MPIDDIGDIGTKAASPHKGLRIASFLIAACGLAVLALSSPPSACAAGTKDRVLMIGNSFSKGLKQPLVKLAKSHGRRLKVSSVVKNGATLGDFVGCSKAARKIASATWKYVILQEQSAGMYESRFPSARALDALIQQAGTQTMFFMTWRDRGQAPATYGYLRGEPGGSIGYVPIAYELGASLAPVGWAFRDAVLDGIYDDLWADDGHHAGRRGQYLAAAVFYAMIYEESPVGLWAPGDMSADEALYYQELAEYAVFGELQVWSSRARQASLSP